MTALAELHEPTRELRERTRLLRRAVGGTAMCLFIAASGAFGVGRISADLRYPLLAGLGLVLAVAGLAMAVVIGRIEVLKPRPALKYGLVQLANLAFATAVCWLIARLFEGARTPPVTAFVGPIVLCMATATVLEALARVASAPLRVDRSAATSISARMPHRLRRAAILAVHGEDHYIRVHTDGGDCLLWMRLGDALGELSGLDGRQTHRCWWVAKSAVVAVRRGNGRAALTLSNGLQAPVSRRFSALLRREGWY